MAIEQIRQCGYRKVGGLYLCGAGLPLACDRLPYELKICPTCGGGIKFTRGWTWLNWDKYAGDHERCKDPVLPMCRVCIPHEEEQPYGLLWCGESFYTPEAFVQEALQMGVSRRIAAIPKNLKLGETWVLFAAKKAFEGVSITGKKNTDFFEENRRPGVFYAFRPQRLELLIWKSEFTHDKAVELEKRHITPILIPDGDVEHDPRTALKPKEGDKDTIFFDDLRNQLGSMRERLQEGE